MSRPSLLILLFAGLFVAPALDAAIPVKMNYQGRLTLNGGGGPIPDSPGNTVVFRIWDAQSLGTQLWIETWDSGTSCVQSKNGLFSVELGKYATLSGLAFDVPYFLEVQVNGDPAMSPRQPLTTAPYAFRAGVAETLSSSTAVSGALVFANNTSSGSKGVQGIAKPNFNGVGVQGEGKTGVLGLNNSTNGIGVLADYAGLSGSYALKVSGPARFDMGSVTFAAHVDFSGATVTGLSAGVIAPLNLTNAAAASTIFGANTASAGIGIWGKALASGGSTAIVAEGYDVGLSATAAYIGNGIAVVGRTNSNLPAIKGVNDGFGPGIFGSSSGSYAGAFNGSMGATFAGVSQGISTSASAANGSALFGAVSSTSAAAEFINNNVAGTPLKLNNMKFPSSDIGFAGKFLGTDGLGNLTWTAAGAVAPLSLTLSSLVSSPLSVSNAIGAAGLFQGLTGVVITSTGLGLSITTQAGSAPAMFVRGTTATHLAQYTNDGGGSAIAGYSAGGSGVFAQSSNSHGIQSISFGNGTAGIYGSSGSSTGYGVYATNLSGGSGLYVTGGAKLFGSTTFTGQVDFAGATVTGLALSVGAPLSLSLSSVAASPLYVSNATGASAQFEGLTGVVATGSQTGLVAYSSSINGNAIYATKSAGSGVGSSTIYAINMGASPAIYAQSLSSYSLYASGSSGLDTLRSINSAGGSAIFAQSALGHALNAVSGQGRGINASGVTGVAAVGSATGVYAYSTLSAATALVAEGGALGVSATSSSGTGIGVWTRVNSVAQALFAANDGSGQAIQGQGNDPVSPAALFTNFSTGAALRLSGSAKIDSGTNTITMASYVSFAAGTNLATALAAPLSLSSPSSATALFAYNGNSGNALMGQGGLSGAVGVYGKGSIAGSYAMVADGWDVGLSASASVSNGTAIYGVNSNASGQNYGVYGQIASNNGAGVLGRSTFTSINVAGVAGVGNTIGVSGTAVANTANATGVIGQVHTLGLNQGYGVRGVNNGGALNNGYGVYGYGPHGVWGESGIDGGYGLRGTQANPTGAAIYGDAGGGATAILGSAPNGWAGIFEGFYGISITATGDNMALIVEGSPTATNLAEFRLQNGGAGMAAIQAYADSASDVGVASRSLNGMAGYFESTTDHGILATSAGGTGKYGVWGRALGGNTAIYADASGSGKGLLAVGTSNGVSAVASAGQAVYGQGTSNTLAAAEFINTGTGSPLKVNALSFPAGTGANGQVLTTNGSNQMSWSTAPTGTVTQVFAGNGLLGGGVAYAPLSVNAGTGANQIVQLNGLGFLPGLNGSNLTNLPPPSAPFNVTSTTSAAAIAAFNTTVAGPGLYGQTILSGGTGVYGKATVAGGRPVVAEGLDLGVSATASSGTGVAIYSAASTSNYGIYSANNGSGPSVAGFNFSAGGTGVYGSITTAANTGVGVYGANLGAGNTGRGVYGANNASGGTGVYGENTAATGSATGVFGITSSLAGFGVYGGNNTAGNTGAGVYGSNGSASGYGVYGYAGSASGSPIGVYGTTSAPSGDGVVGQSTGASNTGIGVSGVNNSGTGHAIWGTNSGTTGAAIGVRGDSASTGGAMGVYGTALGANNTGAGVQAYNTSGSGYGVFGQNGAASGRAVGVFASSGSSASSVALIGSDSASPIYPTGKVGIMGFQNTAGIAVYGRSVAGKGMVADGSTYGLSATASSTSGSAIYARSNSASNASVDVYNDGGGTGVAATANGSGNAVVGNSTSLGSGVYGYNNAAGYGVYGYNDSTGYGVYGDAFTSGTGVYGRGAIVGVQGDTAYNTGYGVKAVNSAASGVALRADALAAGGIAGYFQGASIGVSATSSGTTAADIAVFGRSNAPSAVIRGVADNSLGFGVQGIGSTTGIGVQGNVASASAGSSGVQGVNANAGGFGVMGQNTVATAAANGAAIYANGPIRVQANSTAGGGSTQTLNAPSGRIVFNTGGGFPITVTNSFVTANSTVLASFTSNSTPSGSFMGFAVFVPTAGGSFKVYSSAAHSYANGDSINFVVLNQ